MKKKPIYLITWFGTGYSGASHMAQAVKANNRKEAKSKFLKKFTKVKAKDITGASLLKESHNHYRLLTSHTI